MLSELELRKRLHFLAEFIEWFRKIEPANRQNDAWDQKMQQYYSACEQVPFNKTLALELLQCNWKKRFTYVLHSQQTGRQQSANESNNNNKQVCSVNSKRFKDWDDKMTDEEWQLYMLMLQDEHNSHKRTKNN